MRKPRILLADDHRIFVAGLQKLLESDFEVAGTVEAMGADVKNVKPGDRVIAMQDFGADLTFFPPLE